MEVDPCECMFCHRPLQVTADWPENLAFLEHVERRSACFREFSVWTENMKTDFKGD